MRVLVYFLAISQLLISAVALRGQHIGINTNKGLSMNRYVTTDQDAHKVNIPLFSIDINDKTFSSANASALYTGEGIEFSMVNGIKGILKQEEDFEKAWKAKIRFKNISPDTIELSNVVPFTTNTDNIYITGTGPWALARTKLFRPGREAVSVILPDNAWEMGYGSVNINDSLTLCGIARRTTGENERWLRYKTILYPLGWIEYTLYIDHYSGTWQEGLKLMFQERHLYDMESFDNTLFEREDLSWIKNDYLIVLQFAWDMEFYNWRKQAYGFTDFLEEGKELLGGYDVYGIWPTWPTLGLDQRNQWDMYADLPGGLVKLHELSNIARSMGTKFFIAYNPWDQSTRKEDHYKGMARLIEATDADGVILDCRGSSSYELQHAADSIKDGVVMYSEGMAITKDMPGIIAGRVHNALEMPPVLNLNKLIKPDFAIFRVCQPNLGSIHREVAISFFNGYGNELNIFAPQRVPKMKKDYPFLGKTTMILRENSKAFNSYDWTPLIPTLHDEIWVNQWNTDMKTIYTVYSMIPEGFHDYLFQAPLLDDHHYVSIFHHEELKPDTIDNQLLITVQTDAFNKSWLDTKKEGNTDCIARFKDILEVELQYDSLYISSTEGTVIKVWAGNPSYQGKFLLFDGGEHRIKLYDHFGGYRGKIVVQLCEEDEIMDERILRLDPGMPVLTSKTIRTSPVKRAPRNMIYIQGGPYEHSVKSREEFIPYPDYKENTSGNIKSFYMDKYPVTNKDYAVFIRKSGYLPADTTNYLKHWIGGSYLKGEEYYPVIYISPEDAQAYADWAGKRLPTEIEWQYAARGSDGRNWPWGELMDTAKCNMDLGYITAVDSFPTGASPFGVMDMVGNVWQMTNDIYHNGSNYFMILKGGSYYKPTSSWWYVQGGPKPVNENQMMLLVSPGFNRNGTVGFRCVRDGE